MENDLISRGALIEQLERLAVHEDPFRQSCILGIVHTIAKAPAVDALEVVRCKDCARRNPSADLTDTVLCTWLRNLTMPKDGFCSYGERRGEDGE